VSIAALLAGCGGGKSSHGGCATLSAMQPLTQPKRAAATLRRVIAAEEQLPASPARAAALGQARRALAAVSIDSLNTTLMSAAHRVLPQTNEAIRAAQALCR
jgi:hypothetical protein